MASDSRIVTRVTAELTSKAASPRVSQGGRRRWGESIGSAVVYTGDGFLLTDAHVVGRAPGGTAEFSLSSPTGRPRRSRSSGPIRSPIWP